MDCIICLEKLTEKDSPQICGHVFHLSCLQQQFKPECPLCRTQLNIQVFGRYYPEETPIETLRSFEQDNRNNNLEQLLTILNQSIIMDINYLYDHCDDENIEDDEESREIDYPDEEDYFIDL